MTPTAERRRSTRIERSFGLDIDADTKCIVRDISLHGMSFVARGGCPSLSRALTLHLAQGRSVSVSAAVIWRKEGSEAGSWLIGAEFRNMSPDTRAALLSDLADTQQPPRDTSALEGIPAYHMFIGGNDVDTGEYEYYPYVDKMVVDFSGTRAIIKAIKEGRVPENAREYIAGRYCSADAETVRKAIESAHEAFLQFRAFSLGRRRKLFHDLYEALLANKDELIRLLIIEGHPRKLAEWELDGMLTGSHPRTIEHYCAFLRREIGFLGGERMYTVRRPDGVVCLNPPANAAASNSYNGILVFLTGNTLIVRPPSSAPLSTIFLWRNIVQETLARNGAPAGTVNIVVGNSAMIMREWLASPLVNDIVHFGSSTQGLELGKKIYEAGKKPILELSGNDISIVWRDADIEKATDSVLESFMGSTQICMVPKITLIHEAAYGKFARRLKEKTEQLKVSLPSGPDTILSPVGKQADFFAFLKDAEAQGARLITGGQRVNYRGEPDAQGLYIKPALLDVDSVENLIKMRLYQEEIFFPLHPLVRVSGSDSQIAEMMSTTVNAHNFGLRVSLWLRSARYTRYFAKTLSNCGLLRFNARHIGFSPLLSTHGGTRRSGGPFGEMNYFWLKTSHVQGITRRVDLTSS